MNGNRVFTGNIKVCNYYEFEGGSCARLWPDPESGLLVRRPDEVVKENALLIQVGKGRFIDVDEVRGPVDVIEDSLRNDVLRISPRGCGEHYVDESSLKPYYSTKKQRTSVYQLRKTRFAQTVLK